MVSCFFIFLFCLGSENTKMTFVPFKELAASFTTPQMKEEH